MSRTMARDSQLRRFAPLLIALALAACGRTDGPTAAEPWPITLETPSVVGYAALRPPAEVVDGVCRQLFGFAPAGLDAARPLTVLSLDAKAFGGAYGILVPLRDEDAFQQSLDGAPGLQRGTRGDYVLEVAPDSDLGMLMLFSQSFAGAPNSIMQVMEAMRNAVTQSLPFHVAFEDDWALIAPTFEATSACRGVLRETGGFVASPPQALVVASDLERVRLVYAAEIQRLEDQLRALIGGAQAAGLAGLASGMHGGDGPAIDLGVKWEFLWALKDMLDVSTTVDGVQLTVPQPEVSAGSFADHDDGPAGGYVQSLFEGLTGSVRVQLAPGTPLAALAASLRPAPELPDALVVACDGPAFGRAMADWMRPLAELVKGEGPPCERYLDEAATLLAGFGGTLALKIVDDTPYLLASGADVTPERLLQLRTWLAPILVASGSEAAMPDAGEFTTRELSGGRTLLVAADGTPRTTVGRRGDVVWLCPGEAGEPDAAVTAFARVLAAPPSADAPALCLRSESFDADLRASSGELVLDVRHRDDDGR
jgi:hypothetical protein